MKHYLDAKFKLNMFGLMGLEKTTGTLFKLGIRYYIIADDVEDAIHIRAVVKDNNVAQELIEKHHYQEMEKMLFKKDIVGGIEKECD